MPTDTILYSLEEVKGHTFQEKEDGSKTFVHDVRSGARKLVTTAQEAEEFFGKLQPAPANGDPFRTVYRELTEEEKNQITAVKNACSDLWKILETVSVTADKRGIALAKTHLEEVAMWATNAITA